MKSAFLTTWRGLWRGKTLWTLLVAVAAFYFLLPGLVRSDGTEAGALEMEVRIVCGAVFAVACTVSLAIGSGMLAREREEELLPLSLVRPSSAFSLAAGRWLAVVLLFFFVFFENAVLMNAMLRKGDAPLPDCRVHIAPALPPAEVSAALAMDAFLKCDSTPAAVKKSPRSAVLALLAAKENERYEVVRPGQSASWPFSGVPSGPLSVKVRFSTMYGMKMPLDGVFRFKCAEGVVSNSTQSVIEVPLAVCGTQGRDVSGGETLSFTNTGKSDVMLRPRRDIELLSPGDPFWANSIRASVEMLALTGLLAAFGLFLSSALSRPVALFVAAVLLAASMTAPDAVSQFPDEFNATLGEKAGLAISRAVVAFTSAFSGVSPVSDVASGRAIPCDSLFRTVLMDLAVLPGFLLGLSALVLRRKAK